VLGASPASPVSSGRDDGPESDRPAPFGWNQSSALGFTVCHIEPRRPRKMTDRAEELRSTAAQCLTLAQSTTDPMTRTALVAMAQRLHDLANRPQIDFDAVVQGFNDHQMTGSSGDAKPAVQQQQQIQPKTEDE
jgi:hypothetical protein